MGIEWEPELDGWTPDPDPAWDSAFADPSWTPEPCKPATTAPHGTLKSEVDAIYKIITAQRDAYSAEIERIKLERHKWGERLKRTYYEDEDTTEPVPYPPITASEPFEDEIATIHQILTENDK